VKKLLALLGIVILIAIINSPVHAGVLEPITFEFEMKVTEIVIDDDDILAGILEAGDIIHGTYTFAPNAPDQIFASSFGLYNTDASSLHFDSLDFEVFDTNNNCWSIIVRTETFGSISRGVYNVRACSIDQVSGTGNASFDFILKDFDQTVFTDDSNPLTPPNLDEFEVTAATGSIRIESVVESVTSPLQFSFAFFIGNITSIQLPSTQTTVGGDILQIDNTTLLLAGAQTFSWMIPVVISAVGIGLFVVTRKSKNS